MVAGPPGAIAHLREVSLVLVRAASLVASCLHKVESGPVRYRRKEATL